jgi:hypothetical protein
MVWPISRKEARRGSERRTMRILSIDMEGRGLPRSIPFAAKPRANETRNWITVLSGENGTRKSVLLRLITSAALNRSAYGTSKKWSSSATLNTSGPVRYVLAASGTYSDRFPQVVGAQTSLCRQRCWARQDCCRSTVVDA